MVKGQVLFEQIDQHLMQDEKPSRWLSELVGTAAFGEYPFEMLAKLKDTPQSPQHHPEGNVWNHTLLVVDEAAQVKHKSSDPQAFMWAALLHDIGKPPTTARRKGRITSYDHDKAGAKLAREFLGVFTTDTAFTQRVVGLVRYHMQILFVVKGMPFADIQGMKREVNINDVALLGRCDRLGRKGVNQQLEEQNIRIFLEKSNQGQKETDR